MTMPMASHITKRYHVTRFKLAISPRDTTMPSIGTSGTMGVLNGRGKSGRRLRIQGKGMPVLRSRATGDMYVQIVVETPQKLTKRQRELLNEVAGLIDSGRLRSTASADFGEISAANLRLAHKLIESGKACGKVVLHGYA